MNVEDLLNDKKIYFRVSGVDCLIRCINPEHEDSNPSMRIDKVTGIFNCFSCKFKGNIFKYFNIDQNILDLKRENIKRKIRKVSDYTIGLNFPKDYTPVASPWRNISTKTMSEFEAFKSSEYKDRIVFPIRDIRGKISAFIARSIDNMNPDQAKYMIEPKGAQLPLYPNPIKSIKGRVIVVEGISDMLNLYDNGLKNVIVSFGVNALNDNKLKLLKIMGIYSLDIVFDGDVAGREGAKTLANTCKEFDISTNIIELQEGTDPGSMDQNRVQNLREHLYG